MPYLNLDLDYFSHRKTIRLTAIIGDIAALMPVKLWAYVGKHHSEDGKLDGYSKDELEQIMGWAGENGRCVDAMVKIKFIDETEKGYRIHGWLEHAGHLVVFKKRAKSAAKRRWSKYASSIPTSNAKPEITNAPNLSYPNQSKEEEKTRQVSTKPSSQTDAEWLEGLKTNPAYQHIDFSVEMGKVAAWQSLEKNKSRKITRKFLLNWFGKIERPISFAASTSSTCQSRVQNGFRLEPCGKPATDTLNGKPICQQHKEDYEQRKQSRQADSVPA